MTAQFLGLNLRPIIHVGLHALIPLLVSYLFFPKDRAWIFMIMMLTMLVDLDHLFADPVYDPNRCSIGDHPLHSYLAIGVYFALAFLPRVRVVAFGLLIHMALDFLDCYLMKISNL